MRATLSTLLATREAQRTARARSEEPISGMAGGRRVGFVASQGRARILRKSGRNLGRRSAHLRTFESIAGLPVRILGIRYCCGPCLALLEVRRRLPVVVPEAARRVLPEGARAEQPLRAVRGVHGAARDALRRRLDFRDVVCDARVKHLSAMARAVLCRRGVACGGGAAAARRLRGIDQL